MIIRPGTTLSLGNLWAAILATHSTGPAVDMGLYIHQAVSVATNQPTNQALAAELVYSLETARPRPRAFRCCDAGPVGTSLACTTGLRLHYVLS